MSDPLNRKPWPMKWVVLAIIACVVPYTWISLKYRKPTPAYQPYEDSKQRANVMRLLDAGFQRITVSVEQPADLASRAKQMGALAEVQAKPGGLTLGLAETLVETPVMPLSYDAVAAARETKSTEAYPVAFSCALAEKEHRVTDAQIFVRGEYVVVAPAVGRAGNEDGSLAAKPSAVISLPVGALKPGRYTVQLIGTAESQEWSVTVK